MRNWLSGLTAFGLLALSAACAATPPQEGKPSLKIGDPAPPLKVSKWLQGDEVKAFEPGKVYVVEFWATLVRPLHRHDAAPGRAASGVQEQGRHHHRLHRRRSR